jgi:hypothetical protein
VSDVFQDASTEFGGDFEMPNGKWTPRKKQVRIPKGAKFDLKTGVWGIEQPLEHRPLFDRLLRGEQLPLCVMEDGVYVRIGLMKEPDSFEVTERLTWQEWGHVNGEQHGPSPFSESPDFIITGPGHMISLELAPVRESLLKVNERGLILQPGIREAGADVEISSGFEPEELRAALLLWDRLDWPAHNQARSAPDEDAQFLLNQGIMIRSEFSTLGPILSKKTLMSLHVGAHQQAEAIEPGRWSIAGGSYSTHTENESSHAILVNLHNSIIIPDRNVPLEEVLRFKEKRLSELMDLRHHLEDLYQQIRSAPDEQRAWITASEKLDAAVAAQITVAGEAGWKRLLKAFGGVFEVDMKPALGSAIATYSLTGSIKAAAISGLSSGYSVKAAANLKGSDAKANPMAYVLSMHRDL